MANDDVIDALRALGIRVPKDAIRALLIDATKARNGLLHGVQHSSVVANVGYRPDRDLYAELQVHECYATGGPMKLAASLMKQTSTDCLAQHSSGPETLLTPEPNFYVLGAKSYGRRSNFLVSAGLEQIRDLFRILGDRPTLDLYAGPTHLPT